MKNVFCVIVTIALIGCASTHFSSYWPYSQLPPNKVQALTPKTYDDCLAAIDSVLSPVVKRHFKNQDSTIAVIEICEEIGGFFTTNWRLYRYNEQYHWPLATKDKLPKTPIDIASKFISDGVSHPKAMIRIMFTIYHKHLNGQNYNWYEEISRVKKLWPKDNPTDYSAELPDTVAKIERNKMSKYQFNLLHELDTINMLYNRPPKTSRKSSDWYYLTGIINSKIPETESINIRIMDIESEFDQKIMLEDHDTLRIGDTITEHHKGWLSRNRYYFDYQKCMETRKAFNVN